MGFAGSSVGKESSCNAGDRGSGQKDHLEKEMAPQSSTLGWKIPWTEESGGLQSMRSQESESDTTQWLTTRWDLEASSAWGHTARKSWSRCRSLILLRPEPVLWPILPMLSGLDAPALRPPPSLGEWVMAEPGPSLEFFTQADPSWRKMVDSQLKSQQMGPTRVSKDHEAAAAASSSLMDNFLNGTRLWHWVKLLLATLLFPIRKLCLEKANTSLVWRFAHIWTTGWSCFSSVFLLCLFLPLTRIHQW